MSVVNVVQQTITTTVTIEQLVITNMVVNIQSNDIQLSVNLVDTDNGNTITDTKTVIISSTDIDSVINWSTLDSLIATSLGFTIT